jgi:hypothetical protein
MKIAATFTLILLALPAHAAPSSPAPCEAALLATASTAIEELAKFLATLNATEASLNFSRTFADRFTRLVDLLAVGLDAPARASLESALSREICERADSLCEDLSNMREQT